MRFEEVERWEGEEEVLAGFPDDATLDAKNEDVNAVNVLVPLDRAIEGV